MKGAREGAAEISPKHANVIVNTGGATAAEVLALMRTMRRVVVERFDGAAHRSLNIFNNLVGVPPSLARFPSRARYVVF